jgi:hypothetical protein
VPARDQEQPAGGTVSVEDAQVRGRPRADAEPDGPPQRRLAARELEGTGEQPPHRVDDGQVDLPQLELVDI